MKADLPRLLLRLENAAVLIGSVAMYAFSESSWLLFGLLFLAPDLSMLGYLAGPRVGAAVYNAAHTYALPFALLLVWATADVAVLLPMALVWTAHIGFDRMLGYGLKYPTAFQDTHLGPIGRRAS